MEKSSEKMIRDEKFSINPFNNLLSEVQIKINQPKSSKKIQNYVLQIDSNIDKSNSNINYLHSKEERKQTFLESQSKKNHNHVYVINAPLKTKNSSDTLINQNKERQIITQWIVGYMSKRHILGSHWQHNLEAKRKELVKSVFNKIKYYKRKNINEDSSETKILRFLQIFQFVKNVKKRDVFLSLRQYSQDDQLFGLSNTIKQQKNNSLMLRIQSDYQGLSVSSPKFKKQPKKQFYGSNSSQSNNNITKKKISQSGDGSEDLSALILNHNKLKLSEQLNRSTPNIPKAKNSQKNIKTHQQIGQLSLQTRKLINSQRKLSEEQKEEDLPLQSNKQLKKTKKQIIDQTNQNTNIQNDDRNPVTITFVMKNLNLTSLVKNQQSQNKSKQNKNSINNKNIEQPQKSKIKSQIKQAEFDQNIINKLPFAQSFYQPVNPNNGCISFIKQQNAKRSTSLQIKYNNPILIQKVDRNNYNNLSNKKVFNNQYYPQENNRQNQHFINNHFQVPIQKVRPKSATPKITFTFSNSTSNLHKIPSIVSERRIINKQFQHPHYDQQDCVLQSIINAQPVQIVRPIQVERKHNKIQVISPSRKPQSPKRTKLPQTKMALNHRQHIKNIILPPFNDYYDNQKNQKQNSNIRFMLKDNEFIYTDNLQKSTAQNSIFSPRQSNHNRVKSPKDKIFVTYTNNRNF